MDKTGLLGINSAMKGLIAKSKAGKLLPEEYAVGTEEEWQRSREA